MFKQLPLILLCLLSSTLSMANTNNDISTSQIPFYSEHLTVRYHNSMLFATTVSVQEKQMISYYKHLQQANYQLLLNDLQQIKQQFALNDWFYYRLLEKFVDNVYAGRSKLQRTLSCWFLLSKSGYDTRLTYLEDQVFVYVYTTDALFEVPMIQSEGKTFVNLSTIRRDDRNRQMLYVLNFIPVSASYPFSFDLSVLPQLRPQLVDKELQFTYKEQQHKLKVQLDLTVPQLMSDYPFFEETRYLRAPLSRTLEQSLLPQLRRLLHGKSQREAVELLVSLTRSFPYKEDKEYFGKSKPMIADEVFHYRYSDCEDRSALFYQLTRRLLDLPMVIVAFPDHLTIGVELQENVGTAVLYKKRKYYICDPTGPANSSAIGFIPKNYERSSFKILGTYR